MRLSAGALALALISVSASNVSAAGFEIPENTTLSVARGGTGALSKRDPSALYFNPALLPRARGFQVLVDANLVNLDLSFQRNDLVIESSSTRREFKTSENQSGLFPAPFFAMSHDFGIDDFGVGIGIFGPSAYGSRCTTEIVDGECQLDPDSSAKFLMISSNLVQVYFTAGAGYTFDLLGGELSVGAAAALAYQNIEFKLMVDEVSGPSQPWDESPNNIAPFETSSLTDIQPTGFFGLVYDFRGVRVGASYRPPINWVAEGTFGIEEPEIISELAEIRGDQITLENKQAGSLRTGVAYEHGTHPGGALNGPLFDVEFNFVWEDWSRLENFRIDPQADLFIGEANAGSLMPVYQPKNYQDTYSFRLGGSWGALEWMTAHLGGSYETAAQKLEYTNADFVSWERTTVGAGLSFHPVKWIDIDLAYAHTFMPDRTVTDGDVYQPIPLSGCVGPDYTADACAEPGTPPGNPQNEGDWSASFQIISLGATFKLDGLAD